MCDVPVREHLIGILERRLDERAVGEAHGNEHAAIVLEHAEAEAVLREARGTHVAVSTGSSPRSFSTYCPITSRDAPPACASAY